MGKYNKDPSILIEKSMVESMLIRAKKARDRFLIAFLWLTGARPEEIRRIKKEDIYQEYNAVIIKIPTVKLGDRAGFLIRTRTLKITASSPFVHILLDWQNKTPRNLLCPISTTQMRRIVYAVSDNLLCPYTFRHSRLTKLAQSGASVDFLLNWKGGLSINGVAPYLRARHVEMQKDLD